MYHYISIPPRDADKYRLDLSVDPDNLDRQLKWLRDNGFTTISLYELYNSLATGAALPPKPVILTFDDGYIDAYLHAYPLLQKYGMTGTFFIVSDFINNGNLAYLSWPMVQEMARHGMSIEPHSRTHPDLRNRSFDFLVWQILGPIEAITAYTGQRPHFFCYPSGMYDDAVIRVLRSVDIWGAVTTHYGSSHSLQDSMTWTRIRIRGSTSLAEFSALLR